MPIQCHVTRPPGTHGGDERLTDQLKTEAIARLAGGVAHDFNNLLTVILCYVQLALDGIGPEDAVRADVLEIKNAAESAARVASQLLAVCRREPEAPAPLDLTGVIQDASDIVRRVVSEDIALEFDLDGHLPPVEADRGQVERIVINLVANARDAVSSGGRISVATGHDADENRVFIRVTDTGYGIADEVRERMFEPYFTTKAPGKGTGLGLATVQAITVQLGGTIDVETIAGRTAFTVSFPACSAPVRAHPAHRQIARHRAATPARILVVEDDPLVRKVTVEVLEEAGFEVIHGEPGEALAQADALSASIDLIVADVVMPGMSGPEVVSRVQRKHPGAVAVLMSGHLEHPSVADDSARTGTPVLLKPFKREGLIDRVRAALGQRAA